MKSKSLLILIGIVVVLGLWAFSGYNGMVDKEEVVTTALGNVEAAYQRRADMMPALAKIVKAYAQHERETFEAVTKARNAATQVHLDAENLTPEKMQEFENAQNQLSQAFSRLIAVAESYPELKANQNFLDLQAQLEGTENRIATERMRYNDTVKLYNQKVRRFPTNIIAKILGFGPRDYFEVSEKDNQVPEVKF